MGCELSLQQIAQQMQWKTYVGQASTAVGSQENFSYTLSDTVDANHVWVVFYASAVILGGNAGAENNIALYLIYGKPPGGNNQAYHADPFFGGNATTDANGPPITAGAIRVDDENIIGGGGGIETFINSEIVLVRRTKLIVPPNCTLMAWGGSTGNSGDNGPLGEQFQLKLGFVSLPLTNADKIRF